MSIQIKQGHYLPSVPRTQGRSPSLRTKTFVKVSLSPRLHSRLPFRQFSHVGLASSHFRWRFRHVKQPVRTLCAGGATRAACSDPSILGHSVGEVPARLMPQYFRDLVAGRTLRLDWSTEVRREVAVCSVWGQHSTEW